MIHAQHVGVKYVNINNTKRQELKSLIFDTLRGRKLRKEEFWALSDVSFNTYKGEIIGIIGANGAGKSTLCRVISNILTPDLGIIQVNGMVSALLSLGTGFNTELTGRENIFLNGMMLGFSLKKVKSLYHEIVNFSGIKNFVDLPIKQYSKGMISRLGFSIAAMLEPEILVLDETLKTGDEVFKERASQKLKEIITHAKLVILVSHDLGFIEKRCSRVIWIDKGKVQKIGESKETCAAYKEKVTIKKKKKLLRGYTTTNIKISNSPVITIENLGVKFRVKRSDFWALQSINFTVRKGEIIGVIGHNGAGKSTLCKVLSSIIKADEGKIEIKGRTTEILGFRSGFNKQLSGIDNIFLNGLFLGLSKEKLNAIINDIVEFSELEKFIDKPLKEYSKGMIARLGFSIATAVQPEILIIDEALSAGDLAFYQKAAARIQEIMS
ncbi:MAG: ABC transporter ATP-binding protein, partial [Bacteroidales bacterium]|nr:ABC transporter ATP-binding protein [Bacteroidales bacterium]